MENNKGREDFRFYPEYNQNYMNTNDNRYYEDYQPPDKYYNYPNKHKEPKMEHCCCKKSMREALELLRNDSLRPFINFNQFAFISDFFIVGAYLIGLNFSSPPKDNLSKLDGTFEGFVSCNCDLIDIAGKVSYPIPVPFTISELTTTIGDIPGVSELTTLIESAIPPTIDLANILDSALAAILDSTLAIASPFTNVDLASLCGLKAVAFNVKPSDFDDFISDLTYLLDRKKHCGCNCNCDCDDCCCNKGILDNICMSNISKEVTIVAGSLILTGVKVLGKKGNVLVLANYKDSRIYFVCADAIDYIA